jgi:hypothetical protein
MAMNLPLTGGCLCGAIRYEIFQPPIMVYTCHCTDCQLHITGSAFAIGVMILDETLRLSGKASRAELIAGKLRGAAFAPIAQRVFTANRVQEIGAGNGPLYLGGTLDDTSWLRPTVHVCKQPWIVFPAGDQQFDTRPPSP